MATQRTTNAALQYWQQGDKNWHAQLQTDMQFLDTLPAIGGLQVSPTVADGLTYLTRNVAISPGSFRASTGQLVSYGGTGSFTCTPSATTYLWITEGGGLGSSTSGFPASPTFYCPVGTVVCNATVVTSVTPSQAPFASVGPLNTVYLALAGGTMTGPITCSGTGNNAGVIFASVAVPGAPTEGQVYNDATQKALAGFVDGQTGWFPRAIFLQTNTVQISNSVTETSLVGTGSGSVTLAAGFLTIGKTVRIRGAGFFTSTKATAPGTFQIKVKVGSVTLASITTPPTLGTGLANAPFNFELTFTVRAIGSGTSANGFAQGRAALPLTNGDNQTLTTLGLVNSAVSGGFDSTVANALAVTGQFSVADAANIVNLTNLNIEVLG